MDSLHRYRPICDAIAALFQPYVEVVLHELATDKAVYIAGNFSKRVLGEPFRIVGDRLMQAIATRYRMPDWTPDTHALHKRADSIAAATEAVHCTGWSEREVREVLGITHPVLGTDPLQALYGGTPWEPWPSDVAAARFLDELRRLAD